MWSPVSVCFGLVQEIKCLLYFTPKGPKWAYFYSNLLYFTWQIAFFYFFGKAYSFPILTGWFSYLNAGGPPSLNNWRKLCVGCPISCAPQISEKEFVFSTAGAAKLCGGNINQMHVAILLSGVGKCHQGILVHLNLVHQIIGTTPTNRCCCSDILAAVLPVVLDKGSEKSKSPQVNE